MSILNNRVDTILTPEQLDKLRTAFKDINSVIAPFMQALSPEERKTIPKMSVANKAFVSDAIVGIRNNPTYLPAYMDAETVNRDYLLYEQLGEFLMTAESITEKLSDTQMLAGSEAYISALTIYRLSAAAALAGIDGADSLHERLAKRFDGQGKTTDKTDEDITDSDQPANPS